MSYNIKTGLLTAIVGLAVLTSCGKKQQQQMPSAVYKTVKVSTQTIQLDTEYSATIRGRQDIDVYPQVGGTLQKLCVTEGQTVKKGQTLFIIDQVPFQAALNTAEAALKAAEAQQATAELNYNSRKQLFDERVVSEFDMQTAHNALLSAKAAVAQAKAQVVNARNSLSYTVVKSPSDGVVGTLPYRQGALVGSSMPKPLTTVSDNSQMYVYFSLNESELLKLAREYGSIDSAVVNMPPVRLLLVDGSEYEEVGKVESVSGVVDRSTGSVQLRAVFNNPNKLLHSGSTGNVIIPATFENVIVVPAAATVQTQDKFKVFIVDENGIAHSQLITINEKDGGNEFIVTSGLKGGEEIVAEGAGMVKEGQDVKKLNQNQPAETK
ncbi:MAG: efflux RND transporter periplasmic adaptor subunit [Bacteroidaceae bacterium]|jgi:membrane fusion protein (multidrug efflux system)|nr:efflux RND transporter periplasmic adaptor subunit [Bacteroidaceae bacterium]MBQ5722463.1 efflux RND transporter periplasmic adaptor subunit [Bacteroidaceae bacterium]MBQ5741400.1 efflux RND transporter periplasmic adaptor subunit [Bacteroidaceae bacterium]MEE1088675.1 efflux RND transporter periplasmic adaptor subunit [Bacteroidaceae bacterium]